MRASPTTTIGSVISARLRFSNAQRVATSALTRALGNFPLPYYEADDYQAPVACRWHVSKWPDSDLLQRQLLARPIGVERTRYAKRRETGKE